MLFRHSSWHVGFGYIFGLLGIMVGITLLILGKVSPWWIIGWVIVHHLNIVMVSAGLHRYFCHGCFKTTKFWHNFMILYSPTMLYGSPYAWATAHTTHHEYTDTPKDPHDVSWRYLLFKQFRDVSLVQKRLKRIAGDPLIDFVHRYWFALWLLFAVTLFTISPVIFLFCYLMPMGTAQLFGVIHQLVSHKGGKPNNFPLLEYIFPTGGEWMHKIHHDNPRNQSFRSKWWHLDLGAAFISLVKIK